MTAAPGELKKLGRYELLYLLGQGGMGEVHLARISGVAGFEKLCIVKTILPQVGQDPQFLERFEHEGNTLVQLNHAHIAQVYDMGKSGDTMYMAIEYVAGVDLSRVNDRLRGTEAVLPLNVALFIGKQMCEALGYAHRKVGPDGTPLGLVHRDVSPQNVMVSYEGEVKVIDFGLAKSVARNKATLPSTVLGKLGYMSPEQAMARPLDHRSDIYSAGIVVWEMIAGRPLFEGGTVGEMVARMANPQVPSLRSVRDEVPDSVDKAVLRALQTDPAARYSRSDDFARALNEVMVRENFGISSEEVGNYIRAMCPEEFAAERKLQSRLSSLGRNKRTSSPGNKKSNPSVELDGTHLRAGGSSPRVKSAGRIDIQATPMTPLTPAMRALTQLGAGKSDPGEEYDEPGAAYDDNDDNGEHDTVPPMPGRANQPRSQPVFEEPSAPRTQSAELVVPRSRTPQIVVGIIALVALGAGGVFFLAPGGEKVAVDKPKDPVEEVRPPEPRKPPPEVVAVEKPPAEEVKPAEPARPEPVSLGRVEPSVVLNMLRDKETLWVKLGNDKASVGDTYNIVGEPISAGGRQRDKFGTGVVVEVSGTMARVALDEGDVVLPGKIFAAKEGGARRTETQMREKDKERELRNAQRKKTTEVAAVNARLPDKEPAKPATETHQAAVVAQPEAVKPAPQPEPVKAAPQPEPARTEVAAKPEPGPPPPTPRPEPARPQPQPQVKPVAVANPGPPPPTPAPAVVPRTLTGIMNPLETGDFELKSTNNFAWTRCELRIPPNRVYRFPDSYALKPGELVRVPVGFVRQDTRPPEATVVRGAWALARCTEGAGYLAFDRKGQ